MAKRGLGSSKKPSNYLHISDIITIFAPNIWIMNKKSVLNRLSSLKAPLMAVGVSQLGLFGSTVRGENTRKSDIDILIDFNADQETYLNFIDACSILQSAFGKTKLDVVTKKGLSPYIGEAILKEVEYV